MADLISMLAAAAGAAAGGGEEDPFFQDTVLLLHGDGTDGSQNNTFLDSSTNNFTITRAGNTTQGTFSPFSKPDGRWGVYFDGVDDVLISSGTPMNFGTGDFTFEMWVYPLPIGSFKVIVNTNTTGGIGGGINSDGTITIGRALVATDGTTTNSVTFNAWNHVAWVRNSGTVKIYINGVEGFSGTITTNYPSGALRLGSDNNNTLYYPGYISNARVSASAVYTSAFTPSTSPLTTSTSPTVLTCQSNRFVDNSGNALTFTTQGAPQVTPFSPFPITTAYSPSVNGGAGYVGGASTYLALPSSTPLSLDSTQYEVECWIYPTSWVNGQGIWGASNGGGAQPKVACQISDSSTTINLFVDGAVKLTATVPALNQWTHLLISRATSGTGYLYYNGILQNSGAVPTTAVTSAFQFFTNGEGGTSGMYGYMAGAKVSNVASKTGSNFTVPSAPPTVDANTEFLCNFTNAGILDNTCFNALETVGNAQLTTTKKYGTGSIEFDGTGDYLTTTGAGVFGTGDFTVEFWVNPSSVALSDIIDTRPGTDNAGAWAIQYDGTNLYWAGDGTSVLNVPVAQTPTGSWTHVAYTRESGTMKVWINGTQYGSSVSKTNDYTQTRFDIGVAVRTYYFTGFVDDLRITRGVARYTTTFTPPDKAFPDIGS